MKHSKLTITLTLFASFAATCFLSSCGNTFYGMGLDMERAGRRLQTNHDPYAGSPQQPGYNYNYPQQGYNQAQPTPYR